MIGPNSRILVIDDFELVRTMLRRTLAQMGMENVEVAEDGVVAEKKLLEAAFKNCPFEVILCDWNLPFISGIDLLKTLRKNQSYLHTPFIMITAESEREYIIQALSEGATDYIVKPVSLESIKRKIDSINRRSSSSAA